MNDDFKNTEKETMPGWLREILDATRASDELERRYRRAGEVAWSVTRLRQAHLRNRLDLLDLREYLEELAKQAGVSLASVLDWCSLKEISIWAPGAALARLGRDIGLTREEVFAGLQGQAAENRGMVLQFAARRGSAKGPSLEEQLANVPWDEKTRHRLLDLRKEIWDEYEKPVF